MTASLSRRLMRRLVAPRLVLLAGAFVASATCSDTGPAAPRDVAPGHAAFAVQPRFDVLPAGGPSIPLSKIKGVLTGPTGEPIVVEAQFQNGQAVLEFDVPITGGSGDFVLDLTAFDLNGAVAFTSTQRLTLKPGNNTNVPTPTLKYAGLDAGLTSITITPSTLTLNAGATGTLVASGKLANGQTLTPVVGWTSSDPTIATVDASGNVKAGQSQGSATITAVTATTLTASASVKVQAPVDKVIATPATLQLIRGKTGSVSAELRDAGNHLIDDRTATWVSDDPSIATVTAAGAVTAVKIGKTTLTASAEGKTSAVAVTVISPVDHLELTPTTASFSSFGQQIPLVAKIVPVTGGSVDGLTIDYQSSNPNVVAVDDKGVLTAVGNGAARITGTVDGMKAFVDVTVQQVTGAIVISPRSASVTSIGDTRTFTASLTDARGNKIQNPTVVWQSSDPSIAAVSGDGATGTVTARKTGGVTITASADNKTDAVLFVVAPVGQLLVLTSDKSTIYAGQTATVTAKIADLNGNPISTANATFTTTTPTVASVSSTGVVTGLSAGKAHIVGTSGTMSGSVDINVLPAPGGGGGGGLTISPPSAEKLPRGTQQFTVTAGGTGPFTWTVNGITGGNTTYGTINASGFYTAPTSVPSPSSFDVCANQASPALTGCARVTISPIPSGGADVIVINDMNLMEDFYMTAGNHQFFKNVVGFTPVGLRSSATKVMFEFGHNSRCYLSECGPQQNAALRADMASVGITGIIDDQATTLGAIDPSVKVIYLMNPMTNFTPTEVNNLKAFASEGGRIVYVGENPGYYGSGIQVENQLLVDFGAQLTNSSTYASCSGQDDQPAANIHPHQTTNGVSEINIPCATQIILGPNDYSLVDGPQGFATNGPGVVLVPVIAVAKIDVTPIDVGSIAPSANRVKAKTTVKPAAVPAGIDPTSSTGRPKK